MAKNYYINNNAQVNGDHEVHREDCYWLPNVSNRTYLGLFNNGIEAVNAAKSRFLAWNINGCIFCCPESNTD